MSWEDEIDEEEQESCVLCYRRSRHISIAGLCPECVADLEAEDDEGEP